MAQRSEGSGRVDDGTDLPAERDRPLTFHWLTRSDDRIRSLGFAPAATCGIEVARSSIIAEAMLAHEEGRFVSYSRRKSFYTGRRRYNGSAFTYANILSAVDDLLQFGLIEEERALPGQLGWQSRFRASPSLAEAFNDVEFRHQLINPIWLKDADGDLIDYRDTDATFRMARELRAINDALASLEIDVSSLDVVRSRHHIIVDGAYYRPTKPVLRRIFNRGSFRKGGRAYGWWQSLPKPRRQQILIDGEMVSEPDFAQFHPSLLYALSGGHLDGDAYETGVFSREQGKLAFNVALNTATVQGTIAALSNKPHWTLSRADTAGLLDALARRNAPIARYLHADQGIELMNLDSRITMLALGRCIAAGIPTLPVHDSMLTLRRYEGRVAEIMEESAELVVGRPKPCRVSVSGLQVPQVPSGGSLSFSFPFQLALFPVLASSPLIGELVRSLRASLGLSQASLAVRLGCSQPHIANVEAGRHRLGAWAQNRVRDLVDGLGDLG